ncbi:MAG: nucleotidyltransferase family protein, partial [Rhodanobacteraceae bacterium]|nr:nucleotidyltransferase family protein [Rhodanobacteraceae bacterium]
MTAALLEVLALPLGIEWQALTLSQQLERLRRHRLLPIALHHARAAGAELGAVLEGMWESLVAHGRRQLAADASMLARVFAALTRRDCPVLLLKGAALGRWLYPAPELRLSSDVDILVPPRRRLDTHAAMLDAGLAGDGFSQHDLASNQASYTDPVTAGHIDLHWAMSVVPELACRFEFAQLHARSQP